MLREIKYFFFSLAIVLFILFSIKSYISEENRKKTFRNLSLIDKQLNTYEKKLPVISNDTINIIEFLNNDDNSNKKKYTFWDLLKNEIK